MISLKMAQTGFLLALLSSALGADGQEHQIQSSTGTVPVTGIVSSVSATSDVAPGGAIPQYKLGASDVIHVSVWKSAELSQTVTVRPDGFVSLPLVGDLQAAGLTTNDLANDLKRKLGVYVVNAQVSVSVVEIRSRQVFITGQVGKPGAYPLVTPINVLQLIAQAGGLNPFANRKQILILRGSKEVSQKLRFNYIDAARGDIKQNISLQPGDTVIVP